MATKEKKRKAPARRFAADTGATGDGPLDEIQPVKQPTSEGEIVKPAEPKTGPLTPEELAAYDAETVRKANEVREKFGNAHALYVSLNEDTKAAKKRAEALAEELMRFLDDRKANRGKRPQPTLLDGIKDDADGWRALPVTAGHFTAELMGVFKEDEITTLGELHDYLDEDNNLGEADDAAVRTELNAAIERWEKLKQTPPADALADLWRSFPLARWTEFGLTAKDVEKLQDCQVKTGPSHPITTVGELSAFSTPYPDNPSFTRTWKDIKGFGDAAADRLTDADTKFWAWWNREGQAEFAREKGLTHGDETPAAQEPAA